MNTPDLLEKIRANGKYAKGHPQYYLKKGPDHHQFKHGLCGSPLYKKWEAMKRRCLNKNEKSYERYGGRGITVCDEWLDFQVFAKDMGPSFETGLSLERIDNDKGYSKDNCKWIPVSEQARNKRSVKLYEYKGEKVPIVHIEKELGFKDGTLYTRVVRMGMSLEEAIAKPIRK